jgi:hypothetical protein
MAERAIERMMGKTSSLISLYILLVVLHVIVVWQQDVPMVTPDEISYIAQARFFAGIDSVPDVLQVMQHELFIERFGEIPDTKGWRYYHFGYPLLISPVYALVDEIDQAYKIVQVFNGFLLSGLFLIFYAWLRVITGVERQTACLIAFVTALYPAYILQAYVAWAENLLIIGVAASCLLYARFLRSGNFVTLMAFALVAGLQYAVHPRGLAVVLAAGMVLALLMVFQRDRLAHVFTALVVLVVVFVCAHLFVQGMASLMSNLQQSAYVQKRLFEVFDLNVFPVFAGNLYYLILASLGLFVVGLLYGLAVIYQQGRVAINNLVLDVQAGSIMYLVLLSGITFSVSVLYFSLPFKIAEESLANMVLYGRYNEVFLGLYMALGLVWMNQHFRVEDKNRVKVVNVIYWLIVVLAIPLSMYVSGSVGLRLLHTYGLYPWSALLVGVEGWLRMAPVFVIPLFWSWLILRTFYTQKSRATILVGVYFLIMDLWLFVYITPELQR